MTIAAGSRLGAYEIVSSLGAGGMGEVYRARDARLGREVALKVLPAELAENADRLSRFEQEARAASALNHPNIITIYEVGLSEAVPFIAMELVDGKTLRELCVSGPMPVRRILAIAAQVAEGLAKAHAAGIVHRDLKPENVMVSKDGYVKILDFGLAKLAEPESGEVSAMPTLARPETHPGTVLGTVGYMSPEQASGQPLDFRSDQFSLGSILYEVAAGRKPFSRKTAAETMSAIIREDPEPLAKVRPEIPAPLRWIVDRCMAKEPEERYASTRDLARDLEGVRDHISEISSGAEAVQAPGKHRRRTLAPVLGAAALIALGLGAGWGIHTAARKPVRSIPSFHRVTFRRGSIGNARFTPDGQTIVYGAHWEGDTTRVYLTRPESPESRPFDFGPGNFDILAVSPQGELAVWGHETATGTLSRVPLAGGSPRQVVEDIPYAGADWSPDGKDLVIVHAFQDRMRLEYPVGKTIRETGGTLSSPRFSPRGDRIAFLEGRGTVSLMICDVPTGKVSPVSTGWRDIYGVPGWSPDGTEIWFTGVGPDNVGALFAVKPSGEQRLVTRVPGNLELDDISRDGRVLIGHHTLSSVMKRVGGPDEKEMDLTWLDRSTPADLSADGTTLLFSELGEGGGPLGSVYLRKMDGSPAVRLGEGRALALSPNRNWVLALQPRSDAKERLVVLPTGAGQAKVVNTGSLSRILGVGWTPDSRGVVVSASEPDRPLRIFLAEIDGGPPRPIAPENSWIQAGVSPISPDGRYIAGLSDSGGISLALFPLAGGEVRRIPDAQIGERFIQWSADGESLYVRKGFGVPIVITLLDINTGKRRAFREIRLEESQQTVSNLAMTHDGKTIVYAGVRTASELFIVDGLH